MWSRTSSPANPRKGRVYSAWRPREANWRRLIRSPNSRCSRAILQWPISHLALGRFIPPPVRGWTAWYPVGHSVRFSTAFCPKPPMRAPNVLRSRCGREPIVGAQPCRRPAGANRRTRGGEVDYNLQAIAHLFRMRRARWGTKGESRWSFLLGHALSCSRTRTNNCGWYLVFST